MEFNKEIRLKINGLMAEKKKLEEDYYHLLFVEAQLDASDNVIDKIRMVNESLIIWFTALYMDKHGTIPATDDDDMFMDFIMRTKNKSMEVVTSKVLSSDLKAAIDDLVIAYEMMMWRIAR